MIFTKGSLAKSIVMCLLYFFCALIAATCDGEGAALEFIGNFGVFLLVITPFEFYAVFHSFGTEKLRSRGRKLLRCDLDPAKFLREYRDMRERPDAIINRPSFNTRLLVSQAYCALGDNESAIGETDKMIASSKRGRRNFAMLVKASYLYDSGRFDEAEAIFKEVTGGKLSAPCRVLADSVLKGDRAIASGDYVLAEQTVRKNLERKYPANEKLTPLCMNHSLARILRATGRLDEAREHYRFCAQNGGKTAITADSLRALEELTDE